MHACLLCGRPSSLWWAGSNTRIYRCARCEFLHAWPRLHEGEPPHPPDREYLRQKYLKSGSLPPPRGSDRFLLREIRRHGGRGALCDVGCNVGVFLSAAKGEGFDVCGIEPNAVAARIAVEQTGARVWSAPFEDAPVAPESLDVLVMQDVLEHLPDPLGALRRARTLLRPGGLLVLKTPSSAYTRLKVGVLDPRRRQVRKHLYLEPGGHVQYFSPGALSAAVSGLGFRVLEMRGMPLFADADGRWASLALNAAHRFERALLRRACPVYFARDLFCLAVNGSGSSGGPRPAERPSS